MLYMIRLEDYGFEADKYLYGFNDIFNDSTIKEIHIDVYSNDPYILFSRSINRNVSSIIQDERLMLREKKGNGTVLANIPLDNVDNCMIKRYSDMHYQVVFVVHNVYYKMLVII